MGLDRGKELLGVAEVAEYLGVGTVTIYRWCREGRLPCLKVGRSWRIRREALEDSLRRGGGPGASAEELRAALERNGLDAARLEEEGRLLMVAENPAEKRTDGLRRILEGKIRGGRTAWASFNWTKELDVDRAIAQQGALTELADARQLVIKTAVLERVADGWDPGERRRAQTSHSGTISLSDAGLSLARVTPLSPG